MMAILRMRVFMTGLREGKARVQREKNGNPQKAGAQGAGHVAQLSHLANAHRECGEIGKEAVVPESMEIRPKKCYCHDASGPTGYPDESAHSLGSLPGFRDRRERGRMAAGWSGVKSVFSKCSIPGFRGRNGPGKAGRRSCHLLYRNWP
jgi:hypothetical protein